MWKCLVIKNSIRELGENSNVFSCGEQHMTLAELVLWSCTEHYTECIMTKIVSVDFMPYPNMYVFNALCFKLI